MPSTRATPSHSGPETELLFLLARPRLSPEATERVGALLGGDLNWVLFVGGALSHDVLPLVSQRLLRMPAGPVPDAILDQLKRYVDQHVRRADRLVNELLRLFALLEARSISALTFKGPALAAALYGDASVRAFSDIDFLIHRRDAVRARDVVLQAGYHLHKTPLDEHGFPQDRRMYEYTFMRDDGQAMVELHWRLTPPRLRASLDLEHLGGRHQRVPLNGTRVPTLAAEDALLVLCIHGDKHQWGLLKWILDVAELVTANPDLAWSRVEADARLLGCWRMVGLGVRLASDLLHAPLPDHLSARIQAEPRLSCLVAQVQRELVRGERPDLAERRLVRTYHPFHLVERGADWWWNARRGVRQLLAPNANDTKLVRLPGPLRLGYYPLRLARLLAVHGLTPLVRLATRQLLLQQPGRPSNNRRGTGHLTHRDGDDRGIGNADDDAAI
jgi:hypothetical protein